MPYKTLAAFTTVLVFAVGCEESYSSEDDQITFFANQLRVGRHEAFSNDNPVLQGTRICTACAAVPSDDFDVSLLSCGDGYANSDILGCYANTDFRGYTDPLDGCFVAEGPDLAGVFYFPKSCKVTDFWGFEPREDAVFYRVVDRDQVTASFEQWPEVYADQLYDLGYLVKHTGGGFGADWKTGTEEPFRILTGQEYALSIQLVDDATGEKVAYNTYDLSIDVETFSGPEPIVKLGDVAGTIIVNMFVGSVAQVLITIENKWTYEAGIIMGVAPGAIDSIEVVVAHEDTRESDRWGPPIAGRAIARDLVGNIIHGVPVEWEVTRGRLAVGGDTVGGEEVLFPGTEYVALADSCWKKEQETIVRSAVLKATAMDIEGEAELIWEPYLDDDYVVDLNYCQNAGCGCTTGAEGGSSALVALTVAASLVTRRRRS